MKKTVSIIFIVMICLTMGCSRNKSKSNDSPEKSSFQDNAVYNSEVEEKLVDAKISGGLTVTVRGLSPDYCLDDTTLTCAIVTYFQTEPFILYIGNDIASDLELGEIYTFLIEDISIGKVSMSMLGTTIDYLKAQTNYGNITISSYRKATEDEYGLGGIEMKICSDN